MQPCESVAHVEEAARRAVIIAEAQFAPVDIAPPPQLSFGGRALRFWFSEATLSFVFNVQDLAILEPFSQLLNAPEADDTPLQRLFDVRSGRRERKNRLQQSEELCRTCEGDWKC